MLSAFGEAHIGATLAAVAEVAQGWGDMLSPFWCPLAPCGIRVLSSYTMLVVSISVIITQAELCCEPLSG